MASVRSSKNTLLVSAAATGAGTAITQESRHVTFDVTSTNATTVIQVSWDNSTWRTLHTTTNTTEQFSISEWYPYLRANVTAYSSGTVTVRAAEYWS